MRIMKVFLLNMRNISFIFIIIIIIIIIMIIIIIIIIRLENKISEKAIYIVKWSSSYNISFRPSETVDIRCNAKGASC